MQPVTNFFVSSPEGDIIAEGKNLDLKLEEDISKTSYRVYFNSILQFLSQKNYTTILDIASKKISEKLRLKDILKIIIRAEKHGLLYHPASIELFTKNNKIKFGLNVAISEAGKKWLKEEVKILEQFTTENYLSYLPEIYLYGELNSMFFLLEEWFEGYHEFHYSQDNTGKYKLKLWEFGKGYRFLSDNEGFEIFKQITRILTYYYDIENYNFIYPWHHAAGDFIVSIDNNLIDVKLTTIRRYKPILDFNKNEIDPLMALCFFLLHLSIQMRLDKIDGLGKVIWADEYCLEATFKGFFEEIEIKDKTGDIAKKLISLLKSFSKEELRILFNPLMTYYEGLKDLPVVLENIDNHTIKMFEIIQTLP